MERRLEVAWVSRANGSSDLGRRRGIAATGRKRRRRRGFMHSKKPKSSDQVCIHLEVHINVLLIHFRRSYRTQEKMGRRQSQSGEAQGCQAFQTILALGFASFILSTSRLPAAILYLSIPT